MLSSQLLKHNKSLLVGIVMFIMVVAAALFAPILVANDPLEVKISEKMQALPHIFLHRPAKRRPR